MANHDVNIAECPYYEAAPNMCFCPEPVAGAIPGATLVDGPRINQQMGDELGVDINCLSDIPPDLTLTKGWRVVANALGRRLTTPRGYLYQFTGDDAASTYGEDVREWMNLDINDSDIGELEKRVHYQMVADPRVRTAQVTAKFSDDRTEVEIHIDLDTLAGPFQLIVRADALTVEILDGEGDQVLIETSA